MATPDFIPDQQQAPDFIPDKPSSSVSPISPPGVRDPRGDVKPQEVYLIGGEPKESLGDQLTDIGKSAARNIGQVSTPGIVTSLLKRNAPRAAAHLPGFVTSNATTAEKLPSQIMENALPIMAGAEELPDTAVAKDAAPELGAKPSPKPGSGASDLGAKAKAIGKVAAKDVASHVPVLGRLVRRPSIGDYVDAARTKAIPPVFPGAPLPEHPGTFSETPLGPEAPPPEVLKARSLGTGPTSTDIKAPQSSALGEIPVAKPAAEAAPPPAKAEIAAPSPLPKSQAALDRKLGEQLGKALDAAPPTKPTPGKPIADRLKAALKTKAPEPIPAGEIPSPDSSAVKSYRYDPEAREMHVTTKDGTTYTRGDVSQEQADAFHNTPSKGTAWKNLRDSSSPPVAKQSLGGKRIPVKPTHSRSVGPEGDLTEVLQRSLDQAKQKTRPITP